MAPSSDEQPPNPEEEASHNNQESPSSPPTNKENNQSTINKNDNTLTQKPSSSIEFPLTQQIKEQISLPPSAEVEMLRQVRATFLSILRLLECINSDLLILGDKFDRLTVTSDHCFRVLEGRRVSALEGPVDENVGGGDGGVKTIT